jgi:putative membrane protein
MKILARLLVIILALLLVAQYVPGIEVDGFYTALIVAVILGILNLTIRPILFVLTLPITLLTLGLFSFVLNALLFWFVASFVQGFVVEGFVSAFIGAFLVSVASWIGHRIT